MEILTKILRKLIKEPKENFFSFMIRTLKPNKINNKFKSKLLTIMGADIGDKVSISQGVWIDRPHKICIGDNVVLSRDVLITTSGGVSIGNNSMIGYGSKILSANHRIPENREESIRFSGHVFDKVIIEDDVWIGCNCVILPGVIIKKGAIVGAGTIVTKDLEEYGVYVGSPAKRIRSR